MLSPSLFARSATESKPCLDGTSTSYVEATLPLRRRHGLTNQTDYIATHIGQCLRMQTAIQLTVCPFLHYCFTEGGFYVQVDH